LHLLFFACLFVGAYALSHALPCFVALLFAFLHALQELEEDYDSSPGACVSIFLLAFSWVLTPSTMHCRVSLSSCLPSCTHCRSLRKAMTAALVLACPFCCLPFRGCLRPQPCTAVFRCPLVCLLARTAGA
jgi:succinate dehydrogenase hydrophobic anchor subunit